MLQSMLFAKTNKHAPEGETAKNAELLIKSGFINKSSSGVYSVLPLGFRVLQNINTIIREEMNAIKGEEMMMPSLIHRKHWKQSGRWDVDVIYVAGDKSDSGEKQRKEFEYGLGWTHEEVIAAIAQHMITSYKDLPKAVYQIQTKFRAETRAQAGLLRGREFLMKDLYSFHDTEEDLERYYKRVIEAYKRVFKRLSLDALLVEASGGPFTKEVTHEFQVLHDSGEDTVHYCKKCDFAQNKEIFNKKNHTDCKEVIKTSRAIEVGNVFRLGTKYAEAFQLRYTDKSGNKKHVIMGSYGIGVTRILGTLVEVNNDKHGIIWPESVAPFQVHLVGLNLDNKAVKKTADDVYKTLQKAKIQVLYDDRESASIGEKLGDADLIGIPIRVVVSTKSLPKYEFKKRTEEQTKLISSKELLSLLR